MSSEYNFKSTWGNKEANVNSMLNYVEQAHEKGVKILLFPEMCVTGYVSSSDPESLAYQTAVNLAETSDGPTATTFAEVADTYDMWIIYGATETIEGDSEHAYNSAVICSPEGEVTTYQKISPVEGTWCKSGETPVLIEAKNYGYIGVSISNDTYDMPEISRYYSAKGCNIL
jgi:predicted amidohydrolase